MNAEKTELQSGELFKGPLAVMATGIFLRQLIREITAGEIERFNGLDPVSFGVLTGKVDIRRIVKHDHAVIAAEAVAEQRFTPH